MKITVNLHHLEQHGVRLEDQIPSGDLDLESRDELIRVQGLLKYDLSVEKLEEALLAQGHISVALECDCARCLKTFPSAVDLPEWTVHLPLKGEDAVPVTNDCVDLTPFIREDIFLALPQHPLCSKDCKGLTQSMGGIADYSTEPGLTDEGPSTWSDLDKLKL